MPKQHRRFPRLEPASPAAAPAGEASTPRRAAIAAGTSLRAEEPAAVTPRHHRAIEQALRACWTDPEAVAADAARAARIHAREGYAPHDAFPIAYLRSALEQGFVKPEQIRKEFGDETAAAILASARPPADRASVAAGAADRR